jgi:hypothetical protein
MNEAGGAEEPSKAERSGPHAHRDSLNEDACRTIPCTLDHCGVERRRFGATRGISPPQVTSNDELERPRHGATRALDAMHTSDARSALLPHPSRPAPSEG